MLCLRFPSEPDIASAPLIIGSGFLFGSSTSAVGAKIALEKYGEFFAENSVSDVMKNEIVSFSCGRRHRFKNRFVIFGTKLDSLESQFSSSIFMSATEDGAKVGFLFSGFASLRSCFIQKEKEIAAELKRLLHKIGVEKVSKSHLLEVSVCNLLKQWNVQPSAVLGFGESFSVSAYSAGALEEDEVLNSSMRLENGATLVNLLIFAPYEKIEPFFANFPSVVEVVFVFVSVCIVAVPSEEYLLASTVLSAELVRHRVIDFDRTSGIRPIFGVPSFPVISPWSGQILRDKLEKDGGWSGRQQTSAGVKIFSQLGIRSVLCIGSDDVVLPTLTREMFGVGFSLFRTTFRGSLAVSKAVGKTLVQGRSCRLN